MRYILTFISLTILTFASNAEKSWPNRSSEPVKIIVTFTPGGAPDILARILADHWQKELNNQVIVDNKPGAGGNIGTELTAKAQPNGHTLVIGTVGTLTINPFLYKNLNYDPRKDLESITFLASTPNVLVLNKHVPATDAKSLIALAKSKPHDLSYSSSGIGTSIHLSGELFQQLTNTKIKHIPYKGRAQAMPDLLGGRVHMSFDNLASALPLIKSGDLKAIGVTSMQRSIHAPDIPTLSESGVPGLKNFQVTSWFSLMGPAGMNKADIQKIATETKRILNLPEVKERLSAIGLEANPQGPEALNHLIQQDSKRWSKLIEETGIKAE